MQHHRNYSCGDAGDSYRHPSLVVQQGGAYGTTTGYGHQSTYGYQTNAGQYYVSTQSSMNGTSDPSSQCYSNGIPAAQHSSRYQTEHASDPRYHQNLSVSSSMPYGSQSPYYGSHYSNSADQRAHQTHHGGQFIPTPSELTQTYANYSRHTGSAQPPGRPPEQYNTSHEYGVTRGSSQPAGRVSTSSRSRPSATGSPASVSGERFPCEKCGKTFSRSHDRKRHHETQHLPTPVVHRCQYCEKEFSRADSLKRHLDNGCDEMP